MRAVVHNLGCKTNAYEANAMEIALKNAGYEISTFKDEEPCDVYVINTCSVTNIADRKSRQMIHKAKKMNEDAVVVAVGCFVQSNDREILEKEPIDICLGSNNKHMLVSSIEKFKKEKERLIIIEDISKGADYEELEAIEEANKIRAYIKIEDGCDRFCTYCIIPFARGRVRSRSLSDIKDEAVRYAKNGIREVVITGINISSYGKDLKEEKTDVADIIIALNEIDGIERIRISSLDPQLIDEAFLEKIKNVKKLCQHFHLSMQSGSDGVLERMKRGYLSDEFYKKVLLLKKYYDNPIFTTDVIVGFPGETEEEFEETKEFIKKINFFDIHIFPYSERKNTLAAKMPNKVDARTKSLRAAILNNEVKNIKRTHLKGYIGKTETVLIEEEVNISGINYFVGHTSKYLKVYIKEKDLKINETVKVRLDSVFSDLGMVGVYDCNN